MSGAAIQRGAYGPRAPLPFTPRRIALDGFGSSPRWELVHYLRDGGALCGIPTVRAGLALVGTLKGRRVCARCLDELAAVSS